MLLSPTFGETHCQVRKGKTTKNFSAGMVVWNQSKYIVKRFFVTSLSDIKQKKTNKQTNKQTKKLDFRSQAES